MTILNETLNWLLGKDTVSPIILMLLAAVGAGGLYYYLRSQPLQVAQRELDADSETPEAEVIGTFIAGRRGLWWRTVLAWVCLSALLLLIVPALLR